MNAHINKAFSLEFCQNRFGVTLKCFIWHFLGHYEKENTLKESSVNVWDDKKCLLYFLGELCNIHPKPGHAHQIKIDTRKHRDSLLIVNCHTWKTHLPPSSDRADTKPSMDLYADTHLKVVPGNSWDVEQVGMATAVAAPWEQNLLIYTVWFVDPDSQLF